jgi:transposase
MLSLPPSVKLFVATQTVDGRKGPDSLLVLVRESFGVDVFSGHFFVFFTRRMDRVRIVYWDRDGIAMWTKRLEKGRYRVPTANGSVMKSLEAAELSLILEGINLENAKRRPRWQPKTSN